jgi:hypothetical protein
MQLGTLCFDMLPRTSLWPSEAITPLASIVTVSHYLLSLLKGVHTVSKQICDGNIGTIDNLGLFCMGCDVEAQLFTVPVFGSSWCSCLGSQPAGAF